MKLNEAISLKESPQYDNTKRQVAHMLVRGIIQDIQNFGLTSYDFDGEKFSVKSHDLMFNNPIGKSFTFEIAKKGSRYLGSVLGMYLPSTRTITVGVPAEDFTSQERLINTMLRDSGIHSTMFHEFIHFIDYVEGGWPERISGGTSGLSFTEHSNNPKEISTRTSEIVGDVERYYFEQIRTTSMRKRTMRNWSRSFQEWLSTAERLTILPHMKRHMTEENYKRLLSRLYQYWDTYIKGQESLDRVTSDYDLQLLRGR